MADKTKKPTKPMQARSEEDKQIGMRLRAARVAAGLSQEKMGEALGITFQQIQKYEKGTNRIAGPNLIKVSKVTGKPVAFFFTGVGDPASAVKEMQESYWETMAEDGGRKLIASFLTLEREVRAVLVRVAQEMAAPKWNGKT